MTRRQYLPGNLEGPDVDIEISLKEYGIAWIETDTDILFYYGISHDDENYINFDFCVYEKNLDVTKEFDWASLHKIRQFTDTSEKEWNDLPLSSQISDLVSYYGWENVFGSANWEGLTYQQIMMNW